VGTQINFWVISNVLLGVILHFQAIRITQSLGIPAITRFLPIMVSSVILGVLYGICLGLTDYYLDKRIYKKLPLGKVILFKTATSLSILLLILFFFLRYGLPDLVLSSANDNVYFITGDQSWKYLFYLLMIYYFYDPGDQFYQPGK
jgi:adenylate cyclase